jgi:hypothetical protein
MEPLKKNAIIFRLLNIVINLNQYLLFLLIEHI